MTFAATNLGLGYVAVGLVAMRGHLHTALKNCGDGARDCDAQLHMFAGIGARNIWYGTGFT